jgi:Flp pilus assembly protein TadB
VRQVSKERAKRRAERESLTMEQRQEKLRAQQVLAKRRRRKQRRALAWRRLRLWQHGPGGNRQRENWTLLGTVVVAVLVLTYMFTESTREVLGIALIGLIASPLLLVLVFGRRK